MKIKQSTRTFICHIICCAKANSHLATNLFKEPHSVLKSEIPAKLSSFYVDLSTQVSAALGSSVMREVLQQVHLFQGQDYGE